MKRTRHLGRIVQRWKCGACGVGGQLTLPKDIGAWDAFMAIIEAHRNKMHGLCYGGRGEIRIAGKPREVR